jgi:small subunit ribosomal protein S5
MAGSTIAHNVLATYGAAKIVIRPASPGTGVIAGGAVRAVMESAGIHDVLAKSLGSRNPINVAKATIEGLQQLRDPKGARARRLEIMQAEPAVS